MENTHLLLHIDFESSQVYAMVELTFCMGEPNIFRYLANAAFHIWFL